MNIGDRIVLVERYGKWEAGTPGWLSDIDQGEETKARLGVMPSPGETAWWPTNLVRAEQIGLFTYRYKMLIGYLMMPYCIWDKWFLGLPVEGEVKTAWGATYHNLNALMGEYHVQLLTWGRAVALRRTIFEYTTLRTGVQPLYDFLIQNDAGLPESALAALDMYERWSWYFKEQAR